MKSLSLGAVALLAACSASISKLQTGDPEEAVARYELALEEDPGDAELRIALLRARQEASHAHRRRARELEEASDIAGAAEEITLAIRYDPATPYLRDWLSDVRRRMAAPAPEAPVPPRRERLFSGEPVLDPGSGAPIDLSFAEETSLRTILETLAKLAGVNILFDESYRDRLVSVELKGVTFQEALELLLETNGLFYKVIDSTAVQVAPERR